MKTTMRTKPKDWGWILDVGEDLALDLAEAAIKERKKQKSRRRLK